MRRVADRFDTEVSVSTDTDRRPLAARGVHKALVVIEHTVSMSKRLNVNAEIIGSGSENDASA
jgi:hypothetical protein